MINWGSSLTPSQEGNLTTEDAENHRGCYAAFQDPQMSQMDADEKWAWSS